MNSRRTLYAILAAAALAGCAQTTAYERPASHPPAAWPHAPAGPEDQAAGPSLNALGDPRLDALVERALAHNNNLARTVLAVERARLAIGLSTVNPAVSGQVGADRSLPVRGGPAGTSLSGSLQTSYELDLFGKLKARKDAARLEAKATEQDLDSARIALIASTARLYFQLGFLNQRIALAEESIAYLRRTLDLVRVQRRAGAASGLDSALTEQSLEGQQAGLESLVQQRVEARNALAVLLGDESLAPAEEPPALPDAAPPAPSAGLPASLLGRRPDLKAAELRLREQLAQTDAERLSFYPGFSLTGSLGASSTSLANLLANPVATLGSGLSLPFLQVDQMRLTVRRSRLDYQAAVLGFRQTLVTALAEVDDALSARAQLRREGEALDRSLASARTAERLSEVSYRAGSAPLKFWLDAQESRRQSENAVAANRLDQITSYIALCEALGLVPGQLSPRLEQTGSNAASYSSGEIGKAGGGRA